MSRSRKKPDRGNGPAPNDDGEDVSINSTESHVDRWQRDANWVPKRPGGRTYVYTPSAEKIRLDYITPRDNRLEMWVELRVADDRFPIIFGRSDVMDPRAADPFLDAVRDSTVPWRDGLRRAFYETLIEWRDDLVLDAQ